MRGCSLTAVVLPAPVAAADKRASHLGERVVSALRAGEMVMRWS